jgi:hypothetical protein
MENMMGFTVRERDGRESQRTVDIRAVCLGRAASRDVDAMKRLMQKKKEEGFAVYDPPNVCKKSRYLLTNEESIEVQEPRTTGEVEYVLIVDKGGEIFVSAGSDQNDTTLIGLSSPVLGKVYDTAKTKQACPAVMAREVWRYDDVKDHWDDLRLRSHLMVSGEKLAYQDFPLSDLVDPQYYFRRYPWLRTEGTALFSGSSDAVPNVPARLYNFQAKDGLFPDNFHLEIHDPILKRTISHWYKIEHLEWPDSDVSP